MTNKEIEIIAKSPDIIRKFEELGELNKTKFDSAENNEAYNVACSLLILVKGAFCSSA